MSEYWGARWPEIEAELARIGTDLDRSIEVWPWEKVAAAAEPHIPLNAKECETEKSAIVRWPGSLTSAWLAGTYDVRDDLELPADLVASIDAEVMGYNDILNGLAEQWQAGMNAHLARKWESGDFLKSPATIAGLPSERGFFARGLSTGGWGIGMVLTDAGCPDLVYIRDEAKQTRTIRDDHIRKMLRENGY